MTNTAQFNEAMTDIALALISLDGATLDEVDEIRADINKSLRELAPAERFDLTPRIDSLIHKIIR